MAFEWQQFGIALKKLRLKCGLSQQAVANALHINRATYSYYELGETAPDLQRLLDLAKVFDISPSRMVDLLSDPNTVNWETGQRTEKKVEEQPERLGQLRPEEKALIAMFRLSNRQKRQMVEDLLRQ